MTRQTEDTMYEIHTNVEKLGVRKEFDKQLEKMRSQEKHRWKTSVESWEYAYNKVQLSKK